FDAGEPTMVTNGTGNYSFTGLGPGTYNIREFQQGGWVQTAPIPPRNVAAQSGIDVTVDFGNFQMVSLSGQKYRDVNGNGVKEAGDNALPGWVIYLDGNGNNTLDAGEAQTTTDGSGNYTFTGLGPGTYHVREVPQAG